MSAATKIAHQEAAAQKTEGHLESERVLKGRRGTLYTVESVQDGGFLTVAKIRARRRFAANRYYYSSAGILKVTILVLFLITGALFLTSDSCPAAPPWYSWMYPLACLVAFLSTGFLYIMFTLGVAEENTKVWIIVDLAMTLVEAVGVMVISILTITACGGDHLSNTVLGPLGLTGAALMAVSAAATYIMWRYREEELPPPTPGGAGEAPKPRSSLFI